MSIEKRVQNYKREQLNIVVKQLTEKQKIFFHRIYGDRVSDDDLIPAIKVCERTIIKKKEAKTS